MTTVLYVEDDVSSQRLVHRLLTSEGFDVLIADDGIQALEGARSEKPDLILLEINIDRMDGYEVATRLRSLDGLGDVPIVAVTAATLPGDRERAIVAGCSGYISKPIDVDRFPEQIRAYLAGQEDDLESAEERAAYLVEYNRRLVARLEEKVREQERVKAELKKLEKMKSDFLVLAGHELRTPLTVIYGYMQILQASRDVHGDPEQEGSAQNLLRRISEAVERLNEVTQDILNVSLIDADRLEMSHEPVFINSTVQSVLHNLKSFGLPRALTFDMGLGLRQVPVVEGDSRRLHQALSNVIGNAMKYTPDGGTIFLDAEALDDVLHLWVRDTGVGIPAEELPEVFGRFYMREDTDISHHRSSKTAFKGGGLGLGLAVAKGIVEAHGGKMWAESPGYSEERLPGSTIHILLPIGNPYSWA